MYLQALKLVLSDGSNQIKAWGGWRYRNALWVRLMCPRLRKSACSIPVHYQSKPEIVPSRTCAEVFSCQLKNDPSSVCLQFNPFP